MPLKLRWPFRWPRRKPPARADAVRAEMPAALEAAAPALPAAPLPTPSKLEVAPGPEAMEAQAAPPRPESGLDPEVTAELRRDWLARVAGFGRPPMLGPQAGLGHMAQTLPAVDRFMQALPAAPVQRAVRATLSDLEAVTTLPGLGRVPEAGAPAFPETLDVPAGLTDILPPLGSLPEQWPALTGRAPELAPARPAAPTQVPVSERPAAPAAPPASAPQPDRARLEPPAPEMDLPALRSAGRASQALAASVAPPVQVLPVTATLTGNVLPAAPPAPLLRSAAPVASTVPGLGELVQAPEPREERVSAAQRANIESQRGQGQPLEPEVRQRMERGFGASLETVRVHTGPTAESTVQSLNALAFASGRDVFFGSGTYRPDEPAGLALISHELAHVIQQQYGVPGDPDALRPAGDSLERQADALAQRAVETALVEPPAADMPAQAVSSTSAATPAPTTHRVPAARAEAPPSPAVQGLSLGSLSAVTKGMPESPVRLPDQVPSLDNVADRVSGLTGELPQPATALRALTQQTPGLPAVPVDRWQLDKMSDNLPGLAALSQGLGQLSVRLPGLPAGLPGPGNMGLPGGLPTVQDLGRGAPDLGELPSLGSVLTKLGGELPGPGNLPSLGGLTKQATDAPPSGRMPLGELPGLGGLKPPDMPLPNGLGGLKDLLGGAAENTPEAVGSITSMAPAAPEPPAAPQLPNIEKLTEHIWKQIQHKLRVERERSRGLA